MNEEFRTLNDEQLRKLGADVKAELAEREKARKKETASRIKAMADAAGLSVTVTDKAQKRRGRPPKDGKQ